MTKTEIRVKYPVVWEVFFAPPAPPALDEPPRRGDYPNSWEHARALLKWKNSDGS